MQEENKMKTEHMRRVSIVLLAISVLFWLLRKLELLYIPGVTASPWRRQCCWYREGC